jgi:hypothetical protein
MPQILSFPQSFFEGAFAIKLFSKQSGGLIHPNPFLWIRVFLKGAGIAFIPPVFVP